MTVNCPATCAASVSLLLLSIGLGLMSLMALHHRRHEFSMRDVRMVHCVQEASACPQCASEDFWL